jgi:hypothetical protein
MNILKRGKSQKVLKKLEKVTKLKRLAINEATKFLSVCFSCSLEIFSLFVRIVEGIFVSFDSISHFKYL